MWCLARSGGKEDEAMDADVRTCPKGHRLVYPDNRYCGTCAAEAGHKGGTAAAKTHRRKRDARQGRVFEQGAGIY